MEKAVLVAFPLNHLTSSLGMLVSIFTCSHYCGFLWYVVLKVTDRGERTVSISFPPHHTKLLFCFGFEVCGPTRHVLILNTA